MVARFRSSPFGSPLYSCGVCGKRTRETGHDESSVELCAFCYREAGLENSLSDGLIEQAEFDAELAALRAEYFPTPSPTSSTNQRSHTMPRKPTAKSIKTAVEKHAAKKPAPKPRKVVIQDACAAPGCIAPPQKGSSHCAEHTAKAQRVKVEAPNTQRRMATIAPAPKAIDVRAELGKLIAGSSQAALPVASKMKGGSRQEAVELITGLRAAGWSDSAIGKAVGIAPGKSGKVPRDTVWSWRKAKTDCEKLDELRALAKGATAVAPKSGSLKVAQAASPRMNSRDLADPRQLLLALADALGVDLK